MSNPKRMILVSRDINMRVISDSLGLQSESYDPDVAISDGEEVFRGWRDILMDDEIIDRFYAGEHIHIDEEEHPGINPNEFLMLISRVNEKRMF